MVSINKIDQKQCSGNQRHEATFFLKSWHKNQKNVIILRLKRVHKHAFVTKFPLTSKMPSQEEKRALLELLKNIQNLPIEILETFDEVFPTLNQKQYEELKKIVAEGMSQLIKINKKFLLDIHNIQKVKIRPMFQKLEQESGREEEKTLKNLFTTINDGINETK